MHTKNYFLSFMVAFVFCWTNLAAQEQPFTYVVATDNSGDFTTVQAAVDACKEGEQRSIIFIKNGTYKEMVNVPKGKIISLIGESAEGVRLLLTVTVGLVAISRILGILLLASFMAKICM